MCCASAALPPLPANSTRPSPRREVTMVSAAMAILRTSSSSASIACLTATLAAMLSWMVASALTVAGISVHPPGLLSVKFESKLGRMPSPCHRFRDLVLFFVLAVKHQVTPASSPGGFPAQSAMALCFFVHLVDVRVRNCGRHLFLVEPGGVQSGSKVVQPSLQQEVFHFNRERFLPPQTLERRVVVMFVAAHLVLDD